MTLRIQKLVYCIEAVLILLPAALFLIFSFPWLFAGIQFKAWTATFAAFILWIGGWLGVIGLFQILAHLLLDKQSKINYLWIKSSAGIISLLTSIIFIYDLPLQWRDATSILITLSPIIIGVHWLSALKINIKKFSSTI